MVKGKDYYWTITKEEFSKKLKILDTPYHRDIWNYLQAFIIRGRTEIPLWKECYGLYKINGLLAASISITKMSEDLNISRDKIVKILNDLDSNNYIIKYKSSNKKGHNTNIYILGITDIITTEEKTLNIEKYFVNRNKEMKPNVRDDIIQIYDEQIKTTKTIGKMTEKLTRIQESLFNGGSK